LNLARILDVQLNIREDAKLHAVHFIIIRVAARVEPVTCPGFVSGAIRYKDVRCTGLLKTATKRRVGCDTGVACFREEVAALQDVEVMPHALFRLIPVGVCRLKGQRHRPSTEEASNLATLRNHCPCMPATFPEPVTLGWLIVWVHTF